MRNAALEYVESTQRRKTLAEFRTGDTVRVNWKVKEGDKEREQAFEGVVIRKKRGGVSDTDLAGVRAAGYRDADIAAIVAHVALNVLTNYFNRVAQPVIDFPELTPRVAEAA